VRLIDFPDEWDTGKPVRLAHIEHPSGELHFAAVLLDDESCLYVVTYPGGHRLARTSPHTKWAIEERFDGDPPADRFIEAIDTTWKVLVHGMIEANRILAAEGQQDPDHDGADGDK
jgi:hypothetical protein